MKAIARSRPKRIVLIRHCCIGDAVMATAALSALRETYPDAHISWAVGAWSARAIAHHPAADAIVDIGADMPLRSPLAFLRLVKLLRAGAYDLAVSLARSPLMSLAVSLSGIPVRAGLDSRGRGFGYNLRVPVDPDAREHESEIYLRVISALAGRQVKAYANLPVTDAAWAVARAYLAAERIDSPFIVAHPGGGVNPGARLESKRLPPQLFTEILNRVAEAWGASVILLGGPGDAELVAAVAQDLKARKVQWVDRLSFPEIGALASEALVYIGNDSGLTHLAAASGAKAVMLMGPTDARCVTRPTREIPSPSAYRASGRLSIRRRRLIRSNGLRLAEASSARLSALSVVEQRATLQNRAGAVLKFVYVNINSRSNCRGEPPARPCLRCGLVGRGATPLGPPIGMGGG